MELWLPLAILLLAAGIVAGCTGTRAFRQELPATPVQGHVEHETARLWYGSIGAGEPVILLHGGMASSRSWSGQVPDLRAAGYRVILIDSRGHGRSTLGTAPLSYELMARDVLAVMDRLKLKKAAVVGWSDGAITALVLGMHHGDRLSAVYAFGANMDQGGVRPDAAQAPILAEVGPRLAADYAALSPTPGGFPILQKAVRAMQQVQPAYAAAQLQAIDAPAVTIAAGDHDEFIKNAHHAYLARMIPAAKLEVFRGSGHFTPWQQRDTFNRSVIRFLSGRVADAPPAAAEVGAGGKRAFATRLSDACDTSVAIGMAASPQRHLFAGALPHVRASCAPD